MRSRTSKRFHTPALWIIVAVLLLMILQGYYAYSNHRRQQDLMVDFLSRQGRVFIQALEAGVRTGMMEPTWAWKQLDRLLDELARHPDVIYLQIVDDDGRVLVAAGEKSGITADIPGFSRDKESVAWMDGGGDLFHVAELFEPFERSLSDPSEEELLQRWQEWYRAADERPGADRPIAVVGMSTKYFIQAQQEDLRRAIGTGIVILLLGGAAFGILFVMQSSHAVKQALGEARSYAQNVVDSISNGVFSVDRQGRVVSINDVACQILEVSLDRVIGSYYRELISEGGCRLEPTIETGERILEQEMVCIALGGERVEVSVSVSQLRDDEGEVLGAVVVMRDLREIHELEDQLRRSERLASMGRMVAGVAHELRNPLSSIKGFARYFQRQYSDSAEDGDYARLMIQEVDRLNRVITDMLSFAQPVKPKRAEVDLGEVVDHALLLCEAEIQEKEIGVDRELAAALTRIRVDRDLLIQVLVNLLRNGVEAMAERGRLIVAARAFDGRVEISVADTGCGIADEDRSRIFDPFFTTKQGGTGLGLAIIHSIVESHGGRIHVDSQPGKGAAFRIELPTGV